MSDLFCAADGTGTAARDEVRDCEIIEDPSLAFVHLTERRDQSQ